MKLSWGRPVINGLSAFFFGVVHNIARVRRKSVFMFQSTNSTKSKCSVTQRTIGRDDVQVAERLGLFWEEEEEKEKKAATRTVQLSLP